MAEEHEVFSLEIDVRFRDIDAMGHVNNAVFFTYFENGRLEFSKCNPRMGLTLSEKKASASNTNSLVYLFIEF